MGSLVSEEGDLMKALLRDTLQEVPEEELTEVSACCTKEAHELPHRLPHQPRHSQLGHRRRQA